MQRSEWPVTREAPARPQHPFAASFAAAAAKIDTVSGIALGHPLGASGAVLMTRMAHHMRDNGIRYGLQTMCEGGGTANATLVELVA